MTEYGSGGSFTVTMDGPFSGGGGAEASKLVKIYAPVSRWKGATSPYSQIVDVDSISINSKVDLQLSAEQLEQLNDQIIAFTAENNGGVVTLYAIGDKPAVDCELQATLTEVLNVTAEEIRIIRGNTVTTNMVRGDYNQKDETKPDYIRNKPDEKLEEALETAKNALPKSGGKMTGDVDMGTKSIKNLGDPVNEKDAVNKKYVDDIETAAVVTLPASGWKDKKITVNDDRVTENEEKCLVTISPKPATDNYMAYCESNVRGISQGTGSLTFECDDVPEKDLLVNVRVRRLT